MQITYQPDRRGFLVERPSRTVACLLKDLHLTPRRSGATLMPDLVRVREVLEQENGAPIDNGATPAPAAGVPYRVPKAIRPDQRAHVEYHLGRASIFGGRIQAMLCNQVCCGKTLEALSLLRTLEPLRTLIVCPLGALGTWRSELAKWLGSCVSATDRPDVWRTTWGGAIALRHYEALQARCNEVPATDLLIVDEAHRCTNRAKYTKGTEQAMKHGKVPMDERVLTQAAAVASAAKRALHRVVMTGTEARNMLHDVWGLLRLIDPQRYSSFWTFAHCYFQTEENRWGGVEIGSLRPEWAEAFAAEVGQWQTRSTRAEVFPELGYQVQFTYNDLSPSEQARFDEWFWGPWWEHHKGPLAAITWARQYTIWPGLVDREREDTILSGKLLYAADRLRDADCQVVVCSDFTRALRVLAEELGDRACMIVGGMGDKRLVASKTAFERGKKQFCLIHPQSGGESIDLSMADRLVFLNLPWDVKTFEQVVGRTVRPGRLERGQDPCCIVEVMETRKTFDAYTRETIIEKAHAYRALNETTAAEIMGELKGVPRCGS